MKATPIQQIRTVLAMIAFFTLLILALPVIFLMIVLSFGRWTRYVIEWIAPALAHVVFWIVGIKFSVKKHVDPIPSPAVFISNHSSTIDLFSILALGLPNVRFIAKWELQYNPVFLIAGRLTGQVFIKRQNSKEAVEALQKSYSRIKKQELSVFAAPEGSRKHEGVIGEFKKGAFRMAMDLGYPIVPIYFDGNRELSYGGSLFTEPGKCTAHIHPQIDTSEWTIENLEEKIEEVRNMYLEWAGITKAPNQ